MYSSRETSTHSKAALIPDHSMILMVWKFGDILNRGKNSVRKRCTFVSSTERKLQFQKKHLFRAPQLAQHRPS